MRTHAHSFYQTYFMLPGSCQMEGIISLYNYIMLYLVGILFFVTAALLFIINKHLDGARHNNLFNSASKKESLEWLHYLRSWTHSTPLELIWTIIPTLILIAIASPSFALLYSLDEIVDTQCVVKVVGYQWYWRYEYPIELCKNSKTTEVYYFSYMKPFEELTEMWPNRLLEVDMPLVVPHGVNIKILITSKDVLHSFAVPGLGVKMDAVPGRVNQVVVFIFKPGIYYGQCSELCGVNHAFMPIVLHAISYDLFQAFLNQLITAVSKEEIYTTLLDNWDFFGNDIDGGAILTESNTSSNITFSLNSFFPNVFTGDVGGVKTDETKLSTSEENDSFSVEEVHYLLLTNLYKFSNELYNAIPEKNSFDLTKEEIHYLLLKYWNPISDDFHLVALSLNPENLNEKEYSETRERLILDIYWDTFSSDLYEIVHPLTEEDNEIIEGLKLCFKQVGGGYFYNEDGSTMTEAELHTFCKELFWTKYFGLTPRQIEQNKFFELLHLNSEIYELHKELGGLIARPDKNF